MGRHSAADVPDGEVRGSATSDVALWGGFVTVSTGAVMALFNMNIVATVFVTAVLATGFLLVWRLGASDRATRSASPPLPEPPLTPDPVARPGAHHPVHLSGADNK